MNSISILKRQPRASKLENCFCDGSENYNCLQIKANMENLCFKEILDNEIDIDNKPGTSGSSSWMGAKLERILILFTVMVGLIINWVGASFNVMIQTAADTEPQPPPEEIGVQ